MTDFGWHYPPGVTGLEPQISGDYPCSRCGGDGCDLCRYTGLWQEDPPPCPQCGDSRTLYLSALSPWRRDVLSKHHNVSRCDLDCTVVCLNCKEVS